LRDQLFSSLGGNGVYIGLGTLILLIILLILIF